MAERATRTEALRAGAPVRIGGVVLLPVERIVVHADRTGPGLWVLADKRLHTLVVRDASGIRGIDAEGAAVALDALREEVPGLDAALAAL